MKRILTTAALALVSFIGQAQEKTKPQTNGHWQKWQKIDLKYDDRGNVTSKNLRSFDTFILNQPVITTPAKYTAERILPYGSSNDGFRAPDYNLDSNGKVISKSFDPSSFALPVPALKIK